MWQNARLRCRILNWTIRLCGSNVVPRTLVPLLSVEIPTRGGTTLANLSGILKQLKEERAQVEWQLSGLDAAIRAFANVYTGAKPGRKRRKMSAKGRARIAAAQRARWARVKGQQKVVPIAKPKRSMSASARRKIAAAQRRGGQRSSGRRKPPEGDERRPFSEQARSTAAGF
jgi:hypothetical protein